MIRTFIEAQGTYKFLHKIFGNTRKSTYRYTENILEKYDHLIEYKYLHNSSKRLNQISTEKPITFIKDLKLGTSINKVRKQFKAAPYVKAYSTDGLRRTILLYKIKSGGQKVKIEAHFYKNQLFYSKMTLSEVTDINKESAINSFGEKYGVLGLEFTNKNVIDQLNNCVKINTQSEFSISYMQLNNPFFEKMQEKTAIITDSIPLTYGMNLGMQ